MGVQRLSEHAAIRAGCGDLPLTRARACQGWLSPGDYLALAISSADDKTRLYKREADGTLTTLATAAPAGAESCGRERTAPTGCAALYPWLHA